MADQVVREAADLREEAGVDQQLLVLREALEVGGVERVHLRLRLRDSGTRLEPPDVPPVVAVAALVGLLLGRERERPPEADARRDASKPRGMTPTTVYGWPSMRRSLPTAPGSAAKRLRQSPSLSSTFFSFPGSPSSFVNGRPARVPSASRAGTTA